MLSSKITVVDRAEGFGVKVECNTNAKTYHFAGHLDHETESSGRGSFVCRSSAKTAAPSGRSGISARPSSIR
jgi:hypothetical protein